MNVNAASRVNHIFIGEAVFYVIADMEKMTDNLMIYECRTE